MADIQCVMVDYDRTGGTYQFNSAANIEDWNDVQQAAADQGYEIEKWSDLMGWGEYTECYRLHKPADEWARDLYYFVVANKMEVLTMTNPNCTMECGHSLTWGESPEMQGASLPYLGLIIYCHECEEDQEIIEISPPYVVTCSEDTGTPDKIAVYLNSEELIEMRQIIKIKCVPDSNNVIVARCPYCGETADCVVSTLASAGGVVRLMYGDVTGCDHAQNAGGDQRNYYCIVFVKDRPEKQKAIRAERDRQERIKEARNNLKLTPELEQAITNAVNKAYRKPSKRERAREMVLDAIRRIDPDPGLSRSDRLTEAMNAVQDAQNEIEQLKDELEEWKENMPENLQDGDKAQEIDEAMEGLEELYGQLDDAKTKADEICFPSAF